ncbi:MAG: hypothetical protein PG981_000236 [Wolbachia endosymbiont of Ctenocephalides orientis wCori]|nr:MAG: hypothetical protein PG981_000236 [Wolbachia endosymbiont of Ctenocephalides orientis wCori]
MLKRLLFFVLVVSMLSGCFNKQRKLKSPCIRSHGSSISCELYSVNDYWLNKYKTNK